MKFTQNVKRGVAMLLTLAMLVSSGNFGMIFNAFATSSGDDHSDHLHATLGQVLIDNLDSLTAQQEYLLKNGYLVADKQYHYAPPAEDADLVVVDSEGKTITAEAYTDSEGNVWIPTEFKLTGDAGAVLETGALAANGEVYTGSYTATEKNFSVHITYAYALNLSAEEKEAIKAMVNAGAALNADLDTMEYLSAVSVLSGIDDATKAKILDMVGGIDPNAELVLKALVMDLDRLGGQTSVDLIASLAKDGIYLPLLEEDGAGNITVNEQGVFVNLGDTTSAAYKGALSLKQQQDAQNVLDLTKVLDDYIELCDLALLALHADQIKTALNNNYTQLVDVSAGLKEVQPVINKYLNETVPGIYGTVFATINDALAAYELDKSVNSSEDLAALIAELKATYADGLAQINEKLAGTDYDKNGAEAGAGIATPESITALKAQLEKDYAENVKEINKLLSEYGYKGAPVTDSASLSGPITWADGEYAAGLADLNAMLTENGYTGRPVTDSKGISRPIVWLEDEIFAGLDTINGLLTENGYTGAPVTDAASMDAPIAWLDAQYADALNTLNKMLADSGYTGAKVEKSAGMDAPIAWLDAQYAEAIAKINTEVVKVLRDELGVEIEDVASSADIDSIVTALDDLRADLLKQANDAAAANNLNMTIANEADVDELIKELTFMSAFGGQKVAEALEQAKQLKEALESIAQLKEAMPDVKAALEAMEQAKPELEEGKDLLAQAEQAKAKLVEGKETLAKAEEAMDMLYEAQELLILFEQAKEKIPEVKEKMELAEFAIEALGLMIQLNEAIIKLDEVSEMLGQFDEGVAELEEQADNLKLMIIIMDGFVDTVKPVVDVFAADGFGAPALLRTDLPASTYAAIETAIAGATAYNGEIPDVLTVATATVKVNVAKFDVKIQYKAKVVDPTKADSAELIDLPVYEDVITLPNGASGAEIKAEIAATGMLDFALAQWGIDASKFDVQAQDLADDFVLADNLTYTIVVTPKTYQLTLDFGAEDQTVLNVPYGYRYTTQVHTDSQKEYIYTVITSEVSELEQGSVLTVTENTTITRSQGAVSERKDLLELVAKTVETDATIKNILMSSALKMDGAFSIRLPGKDQVSIVYDAENQVTVIAAPDYDSRVGGLTWIANSVTIDGVTYPMTNGVYETTAAFKQADVHYQLALTTDALGFGYTQILDALNTPYNLVAEYNAQKSTLDALAELMPMLKRLNDEEDVITSPTAMTLREALGMIEHLQASYSLSAETVAAGKALYKLIPVNGHIALYDTLELYSHGGMYHYYRNEELYKTEICQLDDILMVLVNDPAFMQLVEMASRDLFEEIKDTLDAAADVMANSGVNKAKIDVTDANLRTLLNMLDAAEPTLYNRVPTTFNWQEDVHVTGLGYTNVTVNVIYGGVTYTEDHVEATGSTLTVDQLNAWAEAMIASGNIGPEYEEFFTVRNDFADVSLTGEAITFHYTWDVNEYEIKIDGTDEVIGKVNYNYMHLDLPAHTVEGMRYDYMIGDLAVEAGAYELGIEQFKGLVNGTVKLVRIEVNEEEERLQLQEDLLIEFVNNMEGAGIVTKDANGKYTVIFRIDYADIVNSFTNFSMGLFLGGYDEIDFDHHVFYTEGQYYFQAFIDAMLNSGAGTHTILEQINADGTLKHLQLADATVLTNYSYNTLGAELMHSNATFVKDGEALEADFYITIDGQKSEMKTLRDRIALVDQYLEITLEDNQAIAHLTLPEPVYAAYVAALVATGRIDLRHVNDLDTQVALAFLVQMVNPILDKDTADWGAIENTGSMLVGGVGIDRLENAYADLLNNANVDKIQTFYEMITSAYDSEKVVYDDKSVYVPLEDVRIKEFLDLVQVELNKFIDNKGSNAEIDLTKIVAEYNSGISFNLTGHLENMDIDYAALFVAAKADGITNKAGVATAEELLAIAPQANLVILLDDVNGDLNFGSTALLDLNGKTVNGNITGNGNLIIIDSAYQSKVAAVGTVTGNVTGATIISGTYLTDVTACLVGGYVQEADGAVHNKFFTVEDDGANNLTVTLNADYNDLLEMATVKGMLGVAVEATMEVALRNYIYSSLYLDGKQVFDIHVDDIVGIIGGDNKKQDVIDTLKSWASIEDLKYILKDVLGALSDYDALYEALEDGGDGIIYQVDTLVSGYGIFTEKIDNNGNPYYTVSIGADPATTKTGSLTIVVTGDMRLELLKLAKALKDTVKATVSVDISIDGVSAGFENNILSVTGDFAGELVVDFRNHPEYVLMTSVILAHGNPEIRDEMVAAINAYYADDSMEELEKVYNSLTAAQIIAGLNKVDRYEDFFTDMVADLALSDEAKADILGSVDDDMLGFKLAIEVAAAGLRKLGLTGTDRTLGSFLKHDSVSDDNYYGIAKSKEFLGEKTIQNYGVNYDVNIENIGFKLFLFHVHNWDEGVEIAAPDCENEGQMLYTCTACGHTKIETIPTTDHTYGELVAEKPATCTETGLKAHYYCSVCEKYFDENKSEVAYEDLVIPYAHNYGELVAEKPATCTEAGLKAHYYCDQCGKYFDEAKNEVAYEDLIIPAGHSFEDLIEEKPATCTETGLKAHYYCSGCDKYFDENKNEVAYEDLIIPVTDHNYGELVTEKPATCTETGLKAHYYDADCGKYFDENKNEVAYEDLIIPVTDHNYGELVTEKPATCTETGLKAHYYDADCGKYFDEDKNEVAYEDLIIPVKEHNYGEWVEEVPAEIGKDGFKGHYYDADCGKYFDENKNEVTYESLIIPALEKEEKIVVTDGDNNILYAGDNLEDALDAVEDGAVVTVNEPVNQTKDLNISDDITIVGAENINNNGYKIVMTDPSAKITADAELNVVSGVDGYIVENNNNVYTMKEIAAPTADEDIAGVKVGTDEDTKYLFLDLEPVNGETLDAVQNSLTFEDLAGYEVKMAIAGNDGTGLVKTADTMVVTATDANGNVVATITYTVIVLGDVNCDGKALSNDSTATMQIYFGNLVATKPMLLAADINCDGTIETPVVGAADAQRIMYKYFNWGKAQGGYVTALR